MFDCVVTLHMNPLTCGVAKFNRIISKSLEIPLIQIFDEEVLSFKRPLLSIKVSEFVESDLARLHSLVFEMHAKGLDKRFSLFLHDFSDTITEYGLCKMANRIYCGNKEIFERLRSNGFEPILMWSPSTLEYRRFLDATPGELTFFTFGMAHKLRATYYLRLKEILDKIGKPYRIFVSTAIHEGSSFESTFSSAFEQLEEIFGYRIQFLGFLSDNAVVDYIAKCDYFVAFFSRGVRDNNSSVIAAMELGAVVITNLDENSPSFFVHDENVIDLNRVERLVVDKNTLKRISENARKVCVKLDWKCFFEQILKSEGHLFEGETSQ